MIGRTSTTPITVAVDDVLREIEQAEAAETFVRSQQWARGQAL